MKGIPMPMKSCKFEMAHMKWWTWYECLCLMCLKSIVVKLTSLKTSMALHLFDKIDLWIKLLEATN